MKRGRYYVYVIRDPRPGKNNVPIYVGKGQGKRYCALDEAQRAHNPALVRTIAKCRTMGLKLKSKIVKYFEIETEAFMHEIVLIARYGRRDLGAGPLLNMTNGGDGMDTKTALRLHADPKFRKRYEAGLRRFWADPVNVERRLQIISDPEVRERYLEAMRRLNDDPGYRERRLEGIRRINDDPEWHERRNETSRKTMIRLNADPGFIERRDANLSRIKADPGFQERRNERLRRHNADPVFQERRNTATRRRNADPKSQAKCVEGLRRRWAEPEYRQSQIKIRRERMNRLNADLEFQERRRRAHANPEKEQRRLEGLRRYHERKRQEKAALREGQPTSPHSASTTEQPAEVQNE